MSECTLKSSKIANVEISFQVMKTNCSPNKTSMPRNEKSVQKCTKDDTLDNIGEKSQTPKVSISKFLGTILFVQNLERKQDNRHQRHVPHWLIVI